MRKINVWFILSILTISVILASGCSSNHEEKSASHSEESMGDIREKTASIDELPKFLNEKSENMSMIYTAVAQNQDLIEHIPCYCGCGQSVGHKNNYDCFIHDQSSSGEVTWDDHATKCGVCLETAVESIKQYKNGKSIKEIRQMIDEKYKDGYAEPTPTEAL